MHGRKKKDQAAVTPEQLEENRQKVRKGAALLAQLLQDREKQVRARRVFRGVG